MSDGRTSKGKAILRLLFPTIILRWVALSMFAAFVIAFALTELLQMDWIGIVAAIALIHIALICIVTVPTQMTAFASSRTMFFLGYGRPQLLLYLFAIILFFSLALCWLWDLSQLRLYSPVMVLGIWLVTSLAMQISVYLCSRWPVVHLFSLAIYVVLDEVIHWLETYHPFFVAFTLVLSWSLFAFWWFGWRPKKYIINMFFISFAAQQKTTSEHGLTSWFQGGVAKSWVGSRLLGATDSWQARGRRILFVILHTPLGFIPAFVVMGGDQALRLLQNMLFVTVAFIVPAVLANYAFNLRRIWLYTPGGRKEMLTLLQKSFWADVAPITLVYILAALVFEMFLSSDRTFGSWLYYLFSVLLLVPLAFQMYWWVYMRTAGSLLWSTIACVGLLITWLLLLFATGFLLKVPFDWQGISIHWLWAPQVVLLALLYRPVRNGFSTLNLVGGGR